MNKVIPILPCPDIQAQTVFYQHLGFEVTGLYKAPNPYASLKFSELELHFYGTRKQQPAANASMCYVSVTDVDAVYTRFAEGLKQHLGKIPRSGLPRITKVRDLTYDRRFTLTDPGGNTLYVGTPNTDNSQPFFRSLDHPEHAKPFGVLYDLVHSKEDCAVADKLLPKLLSVQHELNALDQARLQLIALEINKQLGRPTDEKVLTTLCATNEGQDWQKIRSRWSELKDS